MLLLLDNYDSFTYNVYQVLAELGAEVEVIRNDQITPEEAAQRGYDAIVLSPGPGLPKDAGITEELIRRMIEDVKLWTDKDAVRHLTINVKPYKKDQNRCPICGAKCPGYDTGRISRSWRALDFGGVIVQIVADTSRIECPHHGRALCIQG